MFIDSFPKDFFLADVGVENLCEGVSVHHLADAIDGVLVGLALLGRRQGDLVLRLYLDYVILKYNVILTMSSLNIMLLHIYQGWGAGAGAI